MSTGDRSSFLLRLAAEFTVIVVGVLLALAVDSWAASRRDRAQETEYLTRLLDDVRFDLRELASVEEVSRLGLDASERLGTPDVVDSMAPGRLVSAVFVAGGVRVPDLSRSTFQELIASGQIELIRSNEVRRALASYDRTANELEGAWNVFSADTRRWYAARIPRRIGDRYAATAGCREAPDDEVLQVGAQPVVCDFDLGGWSAADLRAAVLEESGQEMFRMSEHNFAAHSYFVGLLMEEAKALERVLVDARGER